MLPHSKEELCHQVLEDLREGQFPEATGLVKYCCTECFVSGKQSFAVEVRIYKSLYYGDSMGIQTHEYRIRWKPPWV